MFRKKAGNSRYQRQGRSCTWVISGHYQYITPITFKINKRPEATVITQDFPKPKRGDPGEDGNWRPCMDGPSKQLIPTMGQTWFTCREHTNEQIIYVVQGFKTTYWDCQRTCMLKLGLEQFQISRADQPRSYYSVRWYWARYGQKEQKTAQHRRQCMLGKILTNYILYTLLFNLTFFDSKINYKCWIHCFPLPARILPLYC